MSAVKDLYVDLQGGIFVNSLTDSSEYIWPKIYHIDDPCLAIRFLRPNTSGSLLSPFVQVDISNAALTANLWDSTGATKLASQTVWTKDVPNELLYGALNLNTANMATAFGSPGTLNISTILELTLVLPDGTYTVQKTALTIYRAFNASNAPAPIQGDVYLTLNQAKGIFVPFSLNPGDGIFMTSPDGTKKSLITVDNTGALSVQPIT